MTNNYVPSTGPTDADVMLVGEAPGRQEVEQGKPWVGGAGQELRKMLAVIGIDYRDCFATNACKIRPPGNSIDAFFLNTTEAKKHGLADPDFARKQGNKTTYPKEEILSGLLELEEEIQEVQPKVIVALGGTALWALTRETKEAWCGSLLEGPLGSTIIPTHHPARVLRQWDLRNITISDLRRVFRQLHDPIVEPTWDFTINPSFDETIGFLDEQLRRASKLAGIRGPVLLSCDIETTSTHHIGCIGFATSETRAFCIPFITNTFPYNYWTQTDEIEIILKLRELFSQPNIRIIGQNFAFDAQYIARDFGVVPRAVEDTMVGHHLCYPGSPKGLDYLSRFYLPFHRYWKDEGKFIDKNVDLDQWFRYNCKDCVVTWAVWQRLREQIDHFNLTDQYNFQMKTWHRLLRSMIRGVAIDRQKKNDFMLEAQLELLRIDDEMEELSSGVFPQKKNAATWWTSSKQTAHILHDLLRYPRQFNKKTRRVAVDDNALPVLRKKDILLAPIIDRILGRRSLGVFANTFLSAGLGADGRMRTTYDPTGTETFRLASRQDSFGGGTNLQNIPRLR